MSGDSSLGIGIGLALKSYGRGLTYVKTDRALDLGNLEPFTIPDLSGNANATTLNSGIYVSTNGTIDKAVGANATALGSGNYYLSGKIKPAGTTAKTTMNGSTASNLTGLTAGVWQDFQTATASAITPSSINLGWDGTAFNATVDNWSDVKLHDASDDSVVAHYKLYDSANASLNGYPALDCVGGYHGAHVGCAGGASEASILQTAREDFNINTTTYVGKTVYVAQSEVTQGVDALGNAIANPRPNERVLNLTTGTGYADIADNDSLDLGTSSLVTQEFWIKIEDGSVNHRIIDKGSPVNGIGLQYISSISSIRVTLKTQSSPSSTWDGATDIADGQWHHIIVRLNNRRATPVAGDVSIFIDSADDSATLFSSSSNLTATLTNAEPMHVGLNDEIPTQKLIGQIGDVRQYNRALTADEVLKNYQAHERVSIRTIRTMP
jgi:hypothetical protein